MGFKKKSIFLIILLGISIVLILKFFNPSRPVLGPGIVPYKNVEEEYISQTKGRHLMQYINPSSLEEYSKPYEDISEPFTYGELKEMIDELIIQNIISQEIYSELDLEFIDFSKAIKTEDFLKIYEKIFDASSNNIEKKDLFIIGEEQSETLEELITDESRYKYMAIDTLPLESYLYKTLEVLVAGNEIIYVYKIKDEPITLYNVFINKGVKNIIDVFINDLDITLESDLTLSMDIDSEIGNITIDKGKVTHISIKPDRIQGKVLRAGKEYIEVEGYGKIPLDKHYKTYKTYGKLSIEPTNKILVGYDITEFVVSEGEISAAIISEGIKAKNIRVLLMDDHYKSNYHNSIKITSNENFTVTYGDKTKKYKANQKLTIKKDDSQLKKGRIIIKPSSEKGRIQILSINRSQGNPKYRGTLEIVKDKTGLFIINELPLEEYLYAVIPSEMPTSYALEALKVQAICARSYGYRHILENKLHQYGAHVNDSVSYQVYNNLAENEESILAVKGTYGKVIQYNDEIILAYYFSTSSGHTAAAKDVWGGENTPYLKSKIINIDPKESLEVISKDGEKVDYNDLTIEKNFEDFISKETIKTYDSEFNWYRWSVKIPFENIEKVINEKLKTRYEANPSLIKTLVKSENGESYESLPIETLGTIKNIKVLKRGNGGIIKSLSIEGTKATIKVETEYNIRILLAPTYNNLIRNDGSKVDKLTLLPSAFCIIKKGDDNSITIKGGGYGHGVGMSQNAVKFMADKGKEYEEIIKYFYQGTDIGFIYE